MVGTGLILILWMLCVLLTLSIIFEVSFGTIADWFYRAYTKSPAARRFQDTARCITDFAGTEPTRMTLAIMSNVIPAGGPKMRQRRSAPEKLDQLEELEKVLSDPANQRGIVESIQAHALSQCPRCCPTDEQWVVVAVNESHYSDIYGLFRHLSSVRNVDLVYLRPHASFRAAHVGTSFHTAISLSHRQTLAHKESITISGRTLRLGASHLFSDSDLQYVNPTRHHVALLRVAVG